MSANLTIPHGVLERYPLSLATVVTALWEIYISDPPSDPLCFSTPVEPLLARLGKPCDDDQRRALHDVLYKIYRVQRIGFRMGIEDDTLKLTLWLTPEIVKRIRLYQEQMKEVA